MKLSVGTSGWSYKPWKGVFYPEDLPNERMLDFYAERLPAVEINNTFYRLPRASVLERWAEQVPESFRFALKASRRITHQKRLKDADDETGYLVRTVAALGPRLGVLLFQLPPNLRADRERLERFLELLPEDLPAAFEFRHPSWHEPELLDCLRGRGCALVHTDADGADPVEPVSTASFGYLRLRRSDYARADLAAWAQRLATAGWQQVFAFLKHEDRGPALALELLELAERSAARKGPLAAPAKPDEGRKAG